MDALFPALSGRLPTEVLPLTAARVLAESAFAPRGAIHPSKRPA
jgi:hypothetical protein